MNRKIKLFRSKSEKVNKIIYESTWYWSFAVLIYVFLSNSSNITTDKPSKISLLLKEYNPLLTCLAVPFVVLSLIKMLEFILIFLITTETDPKDKPLFARLIKHFHISYKEGQLVLKYETTLLALQFIFCIFAFFIELKWYLTGTIGMFLYFCLYLSLSYRDLKNVLQKKL